MTRVLLTLVLAALWFGGAVAHAALPAGGLTQLPGTAGCFTVDGSRLDGPGGCSIGRALGRAESAVLSPDGKNVYVGSYQANNPSVRNGSLAVFSRDPASGQLTQLPGPAGCFTVDGSSSDGPNTCTKARGMKTSLGDGRDIAFSSDGRWAYVASQPNGIGFGSILIFQRDPSTGALTQLPGTAGCITQDGASQDGAGTCGTDSTIATPMGLSLSTDDRFVYVMDYVSPNRMHVYSRDSNGGLTPIQCLAEATAPAGCTTGRVLGNSQSLVISADGQHAYGGDFSEGISIFDRDPTTGLLTQKAGEAGCVSDNGHDDQGNATCATGRVLRGAYAISISPNGQTLYDTSASDGGFSVWHVNSDGTLSQLAGASGCVTADGKDNKGESTCTTARTVASPYGSAISPDGSTLYMSDDASTGGGLGGGIAVFSLDPASGQATQLPGDAGCVTPDGSSNGTPGQCTKAQPLADGYGISVSPDGRFVYQTSVLNSALSGVAILKRATAPTCSGVAAAVPHAKPTTVALSCSDADGDPLAISIVSGPGHGTVGAVSGSTVTYTPAATYHGVDSFTFAATDGANTSAAATASLSVAAGKFSGVKLIGRTLIVDSHGNVKLKVRCPADAPGGKCSEAASVFSANGTVPKNAKKAKLLGKARFSVAAGKTATKRFRLNKAGRRLARAHKSFTARLIVRSSSGANAAAKHSYRVKVKHARKRRG